MIKIKIDQCREHYNRLRPHAKRTATAKHLRALLEVSEFLYRENNKKEMELRELRTSDDT